MFSSNPDYVARIEGAGQHRQGINTLGVIAAQAAYDHAEEWQNQVVDYLDGTLDYVESFVNSNMPLVKVVKPQGTYLAWLDVSEVVDRIGAKKMATEADGQVTPETIVQRYFVEHAHVLLNTGSSYGLGGAGHMRMNTATSRTLVELALTNMANALANV